jgi:hypothetical protein
MRKVGLLALLDGGVSGSLRQCYSTAWCGGSLQYLFTNWERLRRALDSFKTVAPFGPNLSRGEVVSRPAVVIKPRATQEAALRCDTIAIA